MKRLLVLPLAGLLALLPIGGCANKEEASIGMAVEFNAHESRKPNPDRHHHCLSDSISCDVPYL